MVVAKCVRQSSASCCCFSSWKPGYIWDRLIVFVQILCTIRVQLDYCSWNSAPNWAHLSAAPNLEFRASQTERCLGDASEDEKAKWLDEARDRPPIDQSTGKIHTNTTLIISGEEIGWEFKATNDPRRIAAECMRAAFVCIQNHKKGTEMFACMTRFGLLNQRADKNMDKKG